MVGRALREDGYIIDTGQGRENFGAFHFWYQRSARTFQQARTFIAIEAKDQKIAQAACILQVTHMPKVEQVKTAVGEDATLSCLLPLTNDIGQFVVQYYFLSRINCQFCH